MFKKLRNKILVSNMILLSFLTVVALSLTYMAVERMVSAENQQRLTQEESTRSSSYNSLVNMLNDDRWALLVPIEAYTHAEGWGTNVVSVYTVAEELEVSGATLAPPDNYAPLSFLEIKPGEDYIVSMTSPFYKFYPVDVYLEAKRQLATTRDNYGSFTLDGRTWLYTRVIEFVYLSDTTLEPLYGASALSGAFLPEDVDFLPEEKREQLRTPRLAMIDITESATFLAHLRLILIASGVVLLVAFFFMSRLMANRAVGPAEASWMRQKQFMSDASHELKTPLAVIRANKEVLQKNQTQTVLSQAKWLDSIGVETDRLSKLVDTLLILSKGDETPAELEVLDISQLVEEVSTEFEALFFEKGLELRTDITPELQALAEAGSLKTAFTALYENALQYSPEGQEVLVALAREPKQIVFTLRNTGVSLSKGALAKLFDRFYQADQARSTKTGGFGLGLSIAQSAVLRSGGKIEASSDEDSVTITVQLKSS